MIRRAVWTLAGLLLAIQLIPLAGAADKVKPIYQGISEELFQAYLVGMGWGNWATKWKIRRSPRCRPAS